MFRDTYTITLEEPCLLLDNTGTEINIRSLDYIPGNIFRGLTTAALYDSCTTPEALELFHDGTVRYHDANPMINGKRSWRIPLAWHTFKGCSFNAGVNSFYSSVLKDIAIEKKIEENGIQLEGISGFFALENTPTNIPSLSYGKPEYGMALKSRHDREKGTSMDAHLFMYKYLRAGQKFMFYISSEKENLLDTIRRVLHNKSHQIGKSKRNEFGKVWIDCIKENEEIPVNNLPAGSDNIVFYADSDLCFLGDYGGYTTQLTAEHFGLTSGTIDYSESRGSIRKYYPYNHKRRTYDPERIVLSKGSVIIIKGVKLPQNFPYLHGSHSIGVHRSEGLGHVLVNPEWLLGPLPTIITEMEIDHHTFKPNFSSQIDSNDPRSLSFINILEDLKAKRHHESKVEDALVDFMHNESPKMKISASQWGRVYGECITTTSPDQESAISSIINNLKEGKTAQKWEGKTERLHTFLTTNEKWKLHPNLLKRISREMQKKKSD